MNIAQIEENVKSLLANLASGQCTQDDFIYELLLAYGHRKQSVSRLRSGERNLAIKGKGASVEASHNEIIWKRHLYYKQVEGNALLSEIDQMRKEKLVSTNKIRFIIVTDFDHLFAHDLKTNDRLDISLSELPNKFDFFLPWAGMEKAVYQGENPADVKAAEKMAKLFDLIKDDNFDETNKDDTEALHGLNVFLTRLLFCFFAEDTEIFKDNQFSNAIQSHTKDDGCDLSDYLNRLFLVLNTADRDRAQLPNAPLPEYLDNFPYVNGGLFADDIPSPTFSAKSRRMLIECGSQLDWSDINPDIFGSMIQAVVHPDQRGGMGMHYTSVTNIMKVIEPLFLNDLYEELEKSENSATKLQKLQQRLGEIKIFDPACGSGNFLIIAYKELRKLEMEVLKRLQEIELEKSGQISQPFSVIKLSQFYGIELDDFAHEVAILSLWLAEHQMNVEFKTEFGESKASLPLNNSGGIICGNAARHCWMDVCPVELDSELYILGNPPYLGARQQNPEQKEDMKIVMPKVKGLNNLDYISIWFFKAAELIAGKAGCSFAFVSTNSISQGAQVAIIWPQIFSKGVEIFFAYTSFKWTNNARDKAGVTCVIIGIRNIKRISIKRLFDAGLIHNAEHINGYLTNASDLIVENRRNPISNLPPINYGSFALDDGNFTLNLSEYEELVSTNPEAKKYLRPFIGAKELLQSQKRFCLWLDDQEYKSIAPIVEKVERVRYWRKNSSRKATVSLASTPHLFAEIRQPETQYLAIPTISSERREYLPVGFLNKNVIASNQIYIIPNASAFHLGLLSSTLHIAWVKSVCGQLETRIRYSAAICYNNFPVPDVSAEKKDEIAMAAMKLLAIREMYPDKSLAKLYDPELMPSDLRESHRKLDKLVEGIYSDKPFSTNEERLNCLFRLYEKMTGGQNA